ncbi:MAG TPA: TrkH family potassium uptake protein [Bacteroidales bacterium]|nr:TrkH family potassium uptake protein [Bacteroidales bacterium]
MINYRVVGFILGILLLIEGLFMLLSVPVSLIYREGDSLPILVSSAITFFAGVLLFLFFRKADMNIGKREGFIIVSSGWIVFSIFGALPFCITGAIPSYTDAFFETMSGFTTTGASILTDVEALSHGLHFWRSLTQWLGGMGIIVLSLVILPVLGIGGMQLFNAEAPGPTIDKIHPRIKETAKRLWVIYLILTIAEIILLTAGGMNIFDSICHSFATMATGGYSTKNASIGFYASPFIHYVITFFMIIAGTNFALSYSAMHLKFKPLFGNEEFRFYISFIVIFSFIIALILSLTIAQPVEKSFRDSLFQVVSIMTTTGFTTTDYLRWIPIGYVILFALMFFGGSSGSTAGSIKIMRIVLVLKNSFLELKRLIHPNAVIPVRFNTQVVSPQIITNVLAFSSLYIVIVLISVIIISFLGYDLDTSFGAVAATLGNIGPGIGQVGPMFNYAHFPLMGKWYLSFLMLIGRLELFTVLILFSRHFWKE